MKRLNILLLLLCLALSGPVSSQDRCGTDQYLKKLQLKGFESDRQFEQWIQQKIRTKAHGVSETGRTEATFQIPVVVHVIHNGVDHPSNISDAQILSQLKVLNNDYNRTNADAVNTPSVFTSVAGGISIEFILAKQTPEGLPTNGINRIRGPKDEWTSSDNYQLKALSYWPAEHYMNIWVCNLTDYLGFAQFPQSSSIPDLQGSSSLNRLTDGVVITYSAFGSIDDGNFPLQSTYNKGRTTTHEVGHFFGLRHIWGDDEGDCGGNGDYVSDTPDQGNRTYNCPTHPRTTCNTVSMFQNYLDYTNDACMNLFTKGQVQRMTAVVQNSPRRASLLTSPGLEEPQPVANDAGLREILKPTDGVCAGDITPAVVIRNYGTNEITSVQVAIKKNGSTVETKTFPLSLDELEAVTISFSPINMSVGTSKITFQIITTNGVADGNSSNNLLEKNVTVPGAISTPVSEPLETIPASWQIINPDALLTWKSVPVINNTAGKALMMDFYNYKDHEGEIDIFISPEMDLTSVPVALLLFDVAYAQYQSAEDGFRVVVLTNCNSELEDGDVIYSKSGGELATVESLTEAFEPTSADDWRTESLNLQPYIGQSIRLAFVGINDWGNNLYLDNIKVLTEPFANVTLESIVTPGPIICSTSIAPILRIKNSGTHISSLDIEYNINGVVQSTSFSALNLSPGAQADLTLPTVSLDAGNNELTFSVMNINGEADLDPNDNTISYVVLSSDKETGYPFRERFEGSFENKWSVLSPKGNATWEQARIEANTSQVYEGYVNTVIGDEAWLVSPVFDLSNVSEASMTFEVSYASRNDVSEILQVRVAQGCDSPFEVIESYTGESLSELTSIGPWSPSIKEHWAEQYIDLSDFAGAPEVRLAFIVKNRNGNNLYIDNIQFYSSLQPTPATIEGEFAVYPNPTIPGQDVKLTFNLPDLAEHVQVEVIDGLGKIVASREYKDILNQSYAIDLTDHHTGLYIVRVTTPTQVYFSKLIYRR